VVIGFAIPAFDILLLRYRPAHLLRYQIFVIPLTFLMAIYVLRSLRGRHGLVSSLMGLGMTLVLALSSLVSLQTLSNASIAAEESPVIHALTSGNTVHPALDYSALATSAEIDRELLRLDWDHGVIQCDSSTCFPLNMLAPDPKMFLVTSDRIFESAAVEPRAYGVEYFLVPEPTGGGVIDRLNGLYPKLWLNGDGFATLVGEGKGGGPMTNWRLYRITGPTPRILPTPAR
jgi:hypothetical protein